MEYLIFAQLKHLQGRFREEVTTFIPDIDVNGETSRSINSCFGGWHPYSMEYFKIMADSKH